jgi:hypothetical protein
LTANLPLDPSKHGDPDKPFAVAVKLDVALSDLNQPQTVALPAGAQVVPAFMLLPEPVQDTPGNGLTQYVYIESIGAKGAYEHALALQANDHITITERGVGLNFGGVTKLLSPDGKTLAEDDGYDAHVFAGSDSDAQIADFIISKAGTYKVRITEYQGNAGTFILTLAVKR